MNNLTNNTLCFRAAAAALIFHIEAPINLLSIGTGKNLPFWLTSAKKRWHSPMAVTDVGSHQFRAGYTCGPTPPARRRHPLPSQQLRQHTVRTCRAFIFKYKWKKVWPRRTVVCMFIHDTNHGRHNILPSQHRNSSTPFACNFWFPASNKCTV